MRLFHLINLEHVFLYVFPTLVFIVVFWVFLRFSHFHNADSEERTYKTVNRFPEELADREAPFPLGITLTVIGTVLWVFFYILWHGVMEIQI
ncbi:hypothetical protein D3OALGA1CA_1128 [Olavius algarvensis associated proteobacterium Delta 3]|nr:hypothetical protein D3OALGB2SA_1135 [Olavius algarvensis associated proteobacterium Delta 3]CAB5094763.1 hypothetical protein D3OALGA1CA_1128 [Olavius algarvensis associated proteobacterium Delta 3]